MKVKVLRPFYLGGVVATKGTVVDVTDRALRGALLSYGKIEPVGEEPPAGPMTTENTGLVRGKRAKAETAEEVNHDE